MTSGYIIRLEAVAFLFCSGVWIPLEGQNAPAGISGRLRPIQPAMEGQALGMLGFRPPGYLLPISGSICGIIRTVSIRRFGWLNQKL